MAAILPVTDAYAHCGLRKYRPVDELRRTMERNGVRRTVLVQHRGEYDHSYIEGIVRSEPEVFTGAFLVDLESSSAMDEVTRWADAKAFSGIRLPAASVRTHWPLWVWAAQLGLNFVVDDGVVDHVSVIDQFARQFPKTAVVLTHMGQPDPEQSPIFGGSKPLLALARRRNIYVQVSGMHSHSKPPYRELVPWIRQLHRAFGAGRLMYGSNYPVMQKDEIYSLEISLIREGGLGIPREAAAKVLNDNAVEVWFSNRTRAPHQAWRTTTAVNSM